MTVKRIAYGIHAARVKGRTMNGSYYTFGDGSIGGPHNYKKISFLEFCWLKIYYPLLKNFFPAKYQAIYDRSWGKKRKAK